MTLGEVDYGLIGVVGGLVGFMSFLNGLMASSVARFYAFSVGQAQTASDKNLALDECRRWFNAAVAIHMIVPIVSVLIGYPIGEWAVRNYLTIPPERIEACVWVFRITCMSCFVSMATVPYNAMYVAKQEIAELTIYGFASTTFNVGFLCYMVTHQADWFVRYAGWTAFLSVVPALLVTTRSFVKYHECRLVFSYMKDVKRICNLVTYAGYNLLYSISVMSSMQGMTILVNKMLGPASNATMAIGNSVCGHSMSLTGALRAAFSPAITTAMGANDLRRAENLAIRASIFMALSVAMVAVPLCLESRFIFKLWLHSPPRGLELLCVLLLLAHFVDHLTAGQVISVLALKEISKLQIFQAVVFFIPLAMAWQAFRHGCGVEGVGVGFVVLYIVNDVGKLYFAKRQCRQSVMRWLKLVLFPALGVVMLSLLCGLIPVCFFKESYLRLGLTVFCSVGSFMMTTWFGVLAQTDRELVRNKICDRLKFKE